MTLAPLIGIPWTLESIVLRPPKAPPQDDAARPAAILPPPVGRAPSNDNAPWVDWFADCECGEQPFIHGSQ